MTIEEQTARLAHMVSCVPDFEEFIAENKGDKNLPLIIMYPLIETANIMN